MRFLFAGIVILGLTAGVAMAAETVVTSAVKTTGTSPAGKPGLKAFEDLAQVHEAAAKPTAVKSTGTAPVAKPGLKVFEDLAQVHEAKPAVNAVPKK